MKIGIIGAGAMGCLYASLLSNENDVILLDVSKETVSAINNNGVLLKEVNGVERVYDLKADFSGQYNGKLDLIIVFVKDTAGKAALSSNKNLITDETLLLSLQNGLGNFEIMEEFADKKQILLGTTKHNCVTISPAEIYHSGSGITHIGSPSGNDEAVETVSEVFNKSGIGTVICQDVNRLLWEKLFINMTINSITAFLDAKISVVVDNENTSNVVAKLLKEAIAVANADGEKFDFDKVYSDVMSTAETLGTGKASMCQDIENKRKTEIDFINGAVVKLGKKYGIETPYHEMIVNLIHAKESLF